MAHNHTTLVHFAERVPTAKDIAEMDTAAFTEYWGTRCADYCPYCPCCTAWRIRDLQAAALALVDAIRPVERELIRDQGFDEQWEALLLALNWEREQGEKT